MPRDAVSRTANVERILHFCHAQRNHLLTLSNLLSSIVDLFIVYLFRGKVECFVHRDESA